MKLRIAHINNNQNMMAGEFIVQRRVWGVWLDMWFDSEQKILKEDMVLGQGSIIRAAFNDWHKACRYAREFKAGDKNKYIILQTWKV